MDLGEMSEDVLIEYLVEGNYVRVTAMDVGTLTEVTLIGDRRASQETLKRNVLAKLHYVLANRPIAAKPKQKGILV